MAEHKKYLFGYKHNGSDWSIEVSAESPEDAVARIASISEASYFGEVLATIPEEYPQLSSV